MNTRLQVEHPVTEAVTGLDLVEWQFRIAAGEALPLKQDQVKLAGHAVEARLYAEDPERGFLPSTGKLIALDFPHDEGLRIDSGVAPGDTVSPFYDPMIAKLIAHADTRAQALDRLADALEATVVAGPRSNAGFLAALCRAHGFRAGEFDTGFIDRHLAELGAAPQGLDLAAAATAAQALLQHEQARIAAARASDAPASPWDAGDGFQFGATRVLQVPLIAEGENVTAQVRYGARRRRSVDRRRRARHRRHRDRRRRRGLCAARRPPDQGLVARSRARRGRRARAQRAHPRAHARQGAGGAGGGGRRVTRGQRLAIIEAMKMEHTLHAPIDGTVSEVAVTAESQVAEGAKLMAIVPAKDAPPG